MLVWYVLAAQIPGGTQIVAVQAPTRREAMIFGEKEVRREHKLPTSYQIMGRVVHECSIEDEARSFMDRLHDQIERNKEKDAQASDHVQDF